MPTIPAFDSGTPGIDRDIYALVQDVAETTVWDGSALSADTTPNRVSGAVPLAEAAPDTGVYGPAALPLGLPAGTYSVTYWQRPGGSPAVTDAGPLQRETVAVAVAELPYPDDLPPDLVVPWDGNPAPPAAVSRPAGTAVRVWVRPVPAAPSLAGRAVTASGCAGEVTPAAAGGVFFDVDPAATAGTYPLVLGVADPADRLAAVTVRLT